MLSADFLIFTLLCSHLDRHELWMPNTFAILLYCDNFDSTSVLLYYGRKPNATFGQSFHIFAKDANISSCHTVQDYCDSSGKE